MTTRHKKTTLRKAIRIGDLVLVHGNTYGTIRKVYAFGTADVETSDGRWYRVTGLQFFDEA